MYRNGQTYYQTFSSTGGPYHSSFPKGDPTVKCRRGHPQQGRQIDAGYQKFAIFNQYFRNTDTETEYRDISKYRYRIPNRHEKNTDEYRYRLQIPIPTQIRSTNLVDWLIDWLLGTLWSLFRMTPLSKFQSSAPIRTHRRPPQLWATQSWIRPKQVRDRCIGKISVRRVKFPIHRVGLHTTLFVDVNESNKIGHCGQTMNYEYFQYA